MAPQPNKQPPAIQIETLAESSNRTSLFENRLISGSSLTSAPGFVEVTSHQNRNQNPALP
jgi:hypothetical protein